MTVKFFYSKLAIQSYFEKCTFKNFNKEVFVNYLLCAFGVAIVAAILVLTCLCLLKKADEKTIDCLKKVVAKKIRKSGKPFFINFVLEGVNSGGDITGNSPSNLVSIFYQVADNLEKIGVIVTYFNQRLAFRILQSYNEVGKLKSIVEPFAGQTSPELFVTGLKREVYNQKNIELAKRLWLLDMYVYDFSKLQGMKDGQKLPNVNAMIKENESEKFILQAEYFILQQINTILDGKELTAS